MLPRKHENSQDAFNQGRERLIRSLPLYEIHPKNIQNHYINRYGYGRSTL